MKFMPIVSLACCLACFAPVATADDGPAAATLPATVPTTRPYVPPLVVGAGPPRSFIVEGVSRGSPGSGLAFRIATDGEREACAVYDVTDGTPILLSDGRQTLVYDLANDRVVRVLDSRAYVRVDWMAADERPLAFEFGVGSAHPQKPAPGARSSIRIDRWVEAAAPKFQVREYPDRQMIRFAAALCRGAAEYVVVPAGRIGEFQFGSVDQRQDLMRLLLSATYGEGGLPPAALAFPDPARLAEDITITELAADERAAFVAAGGRAWAAKSLLTIGATSADMLAVAAPGATWDDLRRRDAALGERYRAALRKQNATFPRYTTRPTTRAAD